MTARPTLIFALISLLQWSVLFAQNAEADSIRVVLQSQPEDTNRVNSLLAISWLLRTEDPEEAKDYATQAFELSTELDYLKGKATSKSTLGVIQYRQGNITEALAEHMSALQIRELIGDENGVAKSYINIGNIYTDLGQHADAMSYYSKALEIVTQSGDQEREAMVCLNIGGLYLAQGQNNLARDYCNRTAEIARTIGDPLLEAQALNNTGVCYQNLQMNDSAMWCYKKSYELAEKEGEFIMVIDAGINIGNAYRARKEYASAMQWHNDMILMSRKTGYVDAMSDLYQQLSEDYKAQGDYKNAYLSYVQYKQISDSLYAEEKVRMIAELQLKYETQEKEMAITRLKSELERQNSFTQRGLLWVVAGVVGFILIVGIVILLVVIRSNRRRDRLIIDAQQSKISYLHSHTSRNNSMHPRS